MSCAPGLCVLVGAWLYRTLDSTPYAANSSECQESFLAMPPGWELPGPVSEAATVASSHHWGTDTLVYHTSSGTSCAATSLSSAGCVGEHVAEDASGRLKPSACNAKILIRQVPSTCEPDLCVTHKGYLWRTLDMTPPFTQTYGCQSSYLTLPVGWELPGPVPEAAEVGAAHPWGTAILSFHTSSSDGLFCVRTTLDGGGTCSSSNYRVHQDGNGRYKLEYCHTRVLIRKAITTTTSTTLTTSTITCPFGERPAGSVCEPCPAGHFAGEGAHTCVPVLAFVVTNLPDAILSTRADGYGAFRVEATVGELPTEGCWGYSLSYRLAIAANVEDFQADSASSCRSLWVEHDGVGLVDGVTMHLQLDYSQLVATCPFNVTIGAAEVSCGGYAAVMLVASPTNGGAPYLKKWVTPINIHFPRLVHALLDVRVSESLVNPVQEVRTNPFELTLNLFDSGFETRRAHSLYSADDHIFVSTALQGTSAGLFDLTVMGVWLSKSNNPQVAPEHYLTEGVTVLRNETPSGRGVDFSFKLAACPVCWLHVVMGLSPVIGGRRLTVVSERSLMEFATAGAAMAINVIGPTTWTTSSLPTDAEETTLDLDTTSAPASTGEAVRTGVSTSRVPDATQPPTSDSTPLFADAEGTTPDLATTSAPANTGPAVHTGVSTSNVWDATHQPTSASTPLPTDAEGTTPGLDTTSVPASTGEAVRTGVSTSRVPDATEPPTSHSTPLPADAEGTTPNLETTSAPGNTGPTVPDGVSTSNVRDATQQLTSAPTPLSAQASSTPEVLDADTTAASRWSALAAGSTTLDLDIVNAGASTSQAGHITASTSRVPDATQLPTSAATRLSGQGAAFLTSTSGALDVGSTTASWLSGKTSSVWASGTAAKEDEKVGSTPKAVEPSHRATTVPAILSTTATGMTLDLATGSDQGSTGATSAVEAALVGTSSGARAVEALVSTSSESPAAWTTQANGKGSAGLPSPTDAEGTTPDLDTASLTGNTAPAGVSTSRVPDTAQQQTSDSTPRPVLATGTTLDLGTITATSQAGPITASTSRVPDTTQLPSSAASRLSAQGAAFLTSTSKALDVGSTAASWLSGRTSSVWASGTKAQEDETVGSASSAVEPSATSVPAILSATATTGMTLDLATGSDQGSTGAMRAVEALVSTSSESPAARTTQANGKGSAGLPALGMPDNRTVFLRGADTTGTTTTLTASLPPALGTTGKAGEVKVSIFTTSTQPAPSASSPAFQDDAPILSFLISAAACLVLACIAAGCYLWRRRRCGRGENEHLLPGSGLTPQQEDEGLEDEGPEDEGPEDEGPKKAQMPPAHAIREHLLPGSGQTPQQEDEGQKKVQLEGAVANGIEKEEPLVPGTANCTDIPANCADNLSDFGAGLSTRSTEFTNATGATAAVEAFKMKFRHAKGQEEKQKVLMAARQEAVKSDETTASERCLELFKDALYKAKSEHEQLALAALEHVADMADMTWDCGWVIRDEALKVLFKCLTHPAKPVKLRAIKLMGRPLGSSDPDMHERASEVLLGRLADLGKIRPANPLAKEDLKAELGAILETYREVMGVDPRFEELKKKVVAAALKAATGTASSAVGDAADAAKEFLPDGVRDWLGI